MDSPDYWEKRKVNLYAQVEREETKLAGQLNRYYQTEAAKLSKEIASYYQKYGEGNVLQYRKMLTSLSPDDTQLLFARMDDFAKKYPQYAHLMPVRESIYKLDQMEGLHESMRLQQLEIGAHEIDRIQPMLEGDARRAADLIAERMGFGSNFYSVNSDVVRLTVGARWTGGADFSSRIWDNKTKLADFLHQEFAQGLARGVNYDTMERQLREKFVDRSQHETMRVIRTEATFVLNEAQRQSFMGLYGGDAAYFLSTITDGKACAECAEIENEMRVNPALYSEAEPGINFPPIHPNCRCTTQFALGESSDFIEAMREKLDELIE